LLPTPQHTDRISHDSVTQLHEDYGMAYVYILCKVGNKQARVKCKCHTFCDFM